MPQKTNGLRKKERTHNLEAITYFKCNINRHIPWFGSGCLLGICKYAATLTCAITRVCRYNDGIFMIERGHKLGWEAGLAFVHNSIFSAFAWRGVMTENRYARLTNIYRSYVVGVWKCDFVVSFVWTPQAYHSSNPNVIVNLCAVCCSERESGELYLVCCTVVS